MRRVIIIHGWDEKPSGNWLPWAGKELEKLGWQVEIPEMPNTKNPKLTEWMETLEALKPDNETVLVGHSLGNILIMRYLEKPESKVRGAVMVAVWDWIMEDIREFHESFFESKFDYEVIKATETTKIIVNSSNDPYIEPVKASLLAPKIGARFELIKNAGHFMSRDGYSEFPKMVEIIEGEFK